MKIDINTQLLAWKNEGLCPTLLYDDEKWAVLFTNSMYSSDEDFLNDLSWKDTPQEAVESVIEYAKSI